MYFKPRIFLSPILSKICNQAEIVEFLQSLGADVICYNSHPGQKEMPFNYRQSLFEADFAILIIDEYSESSSHIVNPDITDEYGFLIAVNIPKLIFIRSTINSDMESYLRKLFENKMWGQNIVFLYYDSDQELLELLKSELFTIAHKISNYRFEAKYLSKEQIKNINGACDYSYALESIQGMEEIIKYYNSGAINLIETNILDFYFSYWGFMSDEYFVQYFIQEDVNNALSSLLVDFKYFRRLQREKYEEHGESKKLKLLNTQIAFDYRILKAIEKIKPKDEKKIRGQFDRMFASYFFFRKKALGQKGQFDLFF